MISAMTRRGYQEQCLARNVTLLAASDGTGFENQNGLWQYDSDDHVNKKFIFSAEYLYAHGLRPGDRIIGDPNFNGTPVDPNLVTTTIGPPVFSI